MAPPSFADARLLADVGGTHARFAWQSAAGAPLTDIAVLHTADHAALDDALRHYLAQLNRAAPPRCAIAIATAVVGDEVRMTNHPWSFSIAALRASFGLRRLCVLNDFTALALAVPSLEATDLSQVGGGGAVPGQAVALIGPGTGLGVSGLVPSLTGSGSSTGQALAPLQGEGGHVTLAAGNPREQAVINELARRFGHASAERALSGPGLVNLHQALSRLGHPGTNAPALEAARVTAGAEAGDATCVEAVEIFCSLLGSVAGNLALTLGARGGVYIGGGIVPRLGERFARSGFRRAFEAKGRFADYLRAIPVFVITSTQSPALAGAARALEMAP